MKINARLRKIEAEIHLQSRIPVQDKFVIVGPDDTKDEDVKIEQHLEKLRQQYGEDVSRQDIGILRIVYDKPPEASKETLK